MQSNEKYPGRKDHQILNDYVRQYTIIKYLSERNETVDKESQDLRDYLLASIQILKKNISTKHKLTRGEVETLIRTMKSLKTFNEFMNK